MYFVTLAAFIITYFPASVAAVNNAVNMVKMELKNHVHRCPYKLYYVIHADCVPQKNIRGRGYRIF